MPVVEFCPASKAARRLARIETCAALVDRSLAQVARDGAAARPELVRNLEGVQLKLSLDGERARDELANTEAVSPAGAIAQLLAAVRDIRVDDDDERRRAVQLEMRAVDYLEKSGLLSPRDARRISRTPVAQADQPASLAISSSERS